MRLKKLLFLFADVFIAVAVTFLIVETLGYNKPCVYCGDDNTYARSYDECNGVVEEIR